MLVERKKAHEKEWGNYFPLITRLHLPQSTLFCFFSVPASCEAPLEAMKKLSSVNYEPSITKIYRALIQRFGIRRQVLKTAEESTELAQAALKLLQSQGPVEFKQRRRDLAEEIADVQIVTEQLIDHYDLSELIAYNRNMKLNKIKQLTEGEAAY